MMKLMMIGAVLGMAVAMTGCGTLEAEWGGESAITDKDGAPIVVNGVVQKIKHPNKFSSKRFGIDTKIDTGNMNVTKDGYSVGLNGYASDVSPENAKMITATGDAIANITGRAIAAAMTAGISEITGQAIPAVQGIASQYIAAGGSFTPTITVQRDTSGKIANFTISDGRVTQTGTVPIADADGAAAAGSGGTVTGGTVTCQDGTCTKK